MNFAIVENGIVINRAVADYPLSSNWIEDDGTAEIGGEYDGQFHPAPVKLPTLDQYEAAVQEMLDSKAQSRGYDGIISACSYAGAPNQFQAESQAFITWRGDVWATCYALMADVNAGAPAPSIDELIAALPQFGG